MIPNTKSDGTSNQPSPKLIIRGCPVIKFFIYTKAMTTVGIRTKIKLYKCSTGLVSPCFSSQAPVTNGGSTDLAALHTTNGSLSRCVCGLGSNSIEEREKLIDGGVNSSSSDSFDVGSSSPSNANMHDDENGTRAWGRCMKRLLCPAWNASADGSTKYRRRYAQRIMWCCQMI